MGVSDAVVISLVRNSEGCLERLRLSHAVALTAAATTAIAMFCPLLTHLYLLGCTGLQVRASASAPLPLRLATPAASPVRAPCCSHPPASQSPILDARIAATLDVQVGRDRDGGVLPDPVSSLGAGWGVAGLMRQLDREGPRASLPQEGASGPGADPDIHVRDAGAGAQPRPRWQRLRVLDLTGCAGVWERDVMGLIEGCADLQVRAAAICPL